MEHSIAKTVNSGCITQYMYTVGELTLFGFKIMEIPLKEHHLPIWFLNFMDKTGVFVTHDSYNILISGMENDYNRVFKRSSTSFVDRMYNCLRVGDYIVYDPRFDDVYATNSDGFIKLLETISEYTLLMQFIYKELVLSAEKAIMSIAFSEMVTSITKEK